jgi:hypothetical protein
MHQPHELALIFPPMDAEDYQRLRQDIGANGLLDPIIEFEGKTLDGIHRERACDELGVKTRYEKFTGTSEEATRLVVSKNLARRHLTVGQRADLALKLIPHYEIEAKENQGTRTDLSPDPGRSSNQSAKRAAAAVGLGKTTVETAKRVKKADPDLWQDVVAGKTSVDAADRKIRKRNGNQPAPKSRGDRTANWNGKTNPKRQRELREQKKTGNYAELVRTQLRINELCSALEATTLDDFGLEDATLAVIADIHDDLITLAEWVDRKLHHVGAWLEDVSVRDKIKRLRDTRGRTPEEAATAQRLADRLEHKLEARLAA